jgi:hypothetical protein
VSLGETLDSFTADRVEEMVREQRVEDLQLEFKTVRDPSL